MGVVWVEVDHQGGEEVLQESYQVEFGFSVLLREVEVCVGGDDPLEIDVRVDRAETCHYGSSKGMPVAECG